VLELQTLVQQLHSNLGLQSAVKDFKDQGLALLRLAQTSAGIVPVISLLCKTAIPKSKSGIQYGNQTLGMQMRCKKQLELADAV
jgi:hypothetical protein